MQVPYFSLAKRLAEQGLVELVAACDVVEDKRELVTQKLGIPRFTTDYRDVVEADDVDLVLVLTSMPEHGPITRAALTAGKNVLVEKPMAVTLEEAAEIVELARRSPGLLVPAPHVVLSPTYQTIWARLRRGDIGKVLTARARYGHGGTWWGPWYYRPGGGPLFDLGVYNITCLTGWLGPVQRVTAMTSTAIPERIIDGRRVSVEVEDNAHLLLDFGEATLASVITGFTMQKYRSPALELYGSEGTIQMMGDDWDPDGYEMWQYDVGAWQIFPETAPNWPWTDGLRHLVECIQQGKQPVVTPEHAFHVLEIMVKAKEAGRDGRARTIESSFTPPAFDVDLAVQTRRRSHDRSHNR
jgi:predicted dehydrogenase